MRCYFTVTDRAEISSMNAMRSMKSLGDQSISTRWSL